MKKSTIFISFLVVLIIIFGILIFLPEKKEETIKIGVLTDSTGDYASLMRGIPRGVELAVADLQKESKIPIQVIYEDQQSCNLKETTTIMNKFVNLDKVNMIIGGTCSSTTLTAAPIAEQSKTIMISPASSAPSITNAGDYIFRTYISDVIRAKEGAKLAYNIGKRKMAIIIDINNDATVEMGKSSKEKFINLGGEVIAEERINKADTDFRTILAKIKDKDPDILLLSVSGPNQIALIAKQLRELGLNTQIIVPFETAEDPQILKIAGSAAEDLIYIIPGNPPETLQYKELQNRYKENYQEELPSFVTETYDGVILGVKAVLASDGTKEDIKNKLYDVSKIYEGVSGNVAFDEKGDVVKDALFKQIKNGEFVKYEKI